MDIKLSKTELEMIKRGLSDHISEFCVGMSEEEPYLTLLNKLNDICVEESE